MPHRLTTFLYRNASWLLLVCTPVFFFIITANTQAYTESLGKEANTLSSTAHPPLSGASQFLLVQTESPRETLSTFLRLTRELEETLLAYQQNQNRVNADRVKMIGTQFQRLLDLSSVPGASRREVGIETLAILLDIVGRLDLPPMESVPDDAAFDEDETFKKWRIPHTPIKIVRIEDGPREGEFLFSADTVVIASNYYQQIKHLPLKSSLEIESWQFMIPQIHGPMIPEEFVSILPNRLKQTWFDTPIWKIITVIALVIFATFLLVIGHRVFNLRIPENKIAARLQRALTPLAIILAILVLTPIFDFEVNLAGTFAHGVDLMMTLAIYLAATWMFWEFVLMFFEWIILSPKIPDESLDANLLRLCARVLGFVGSVIILAFGAQALGLPVFGILAGLGVGGLAVALAIRPTLENLIGGAILYTDRPVRVGDFCTFGPYTGTVESIGVRSTQVRARDRTLITVPNAAFADMQIINWAKCDMMQILTTIGLRYETEPDQIRYVLAKLREMLHAHPKIDREAIRVRFAEYGASSLNIEIRVYALTREWNEFYAIREDVFLRVNEIVSESGTSFAFPSQTLYMGRDDGLDKERSDKAMQQVENWRRSRQLPFPEMAVSEIEKLADTLDYPPHGSPSAGTSDAPATEKAESLSAEPEPEDTEENTEQQSGPDKQ